MPRKINKIKLFINNNEKSTIVAKDLELELQKYNFELVNTNFDLGISIGGDGSFLRMIKNSNFNESAYYIGINAGTLGFLQEIDIAECPNFVKRLNSNNFKIEKISIEETKVITTTKIYHFKSLNEIVIRDINLNTLTVPVYIDNELLENFSGDGLLISTSVGSTAYNLSYGGSIIYNTLNTIILTPIAPLNNKVFKTLPCSLIIPDLGKITIIPHSPQDIILSVDGVNHHLKNVLRIETSLSIRNIKCLHMNDYHFAKVIATKILGK